MGPYRFLAPKLIVFGVFLLVPVVWTLGLSLQTGSYLSGLRFNGLKNYETILGDESLLVGAAQFGPLRHPDHPDLHHPRAGTRRALESQDQVAAPLRAAPDHSRPRLFGGRLDRLGEPPADRWRLRERLLGLFGVPQVNWLGSTSLVIIVNSAIEAWRSIPFYAILFLAGMQSIPAAVYEAASIDGVVGIRAFRMITVPLLRPVILFGVVMATIWTLQIFDTPYVVTRGGPVGASTPLTLHIYRVAFAGDNMGLAAAMSVALLALILVVALIELRAFRKEVQF